MGSLFWVLFLQFFLSILTTAADHPFLEYCVNNGNFTNSSTYATNLNNLFSHLSSSTSELNYGFYNFSVGQIPDQVNAIGLCRGDKNADSCRTCLKFSVSELQKRCPNYKEAIAYADECTVHYSSKVLYGAMEVKYFKFLYNTDDNVRPNTSQITDQELDSFLRDLINRTAAGGSLRKCAVDSESIGYVTIYALVQCTPDLSEKQCFNCLTTALGRTDDYCGRQIGGCRILQPSCNFRYELYKFFGDVKEIPPPSPPPVRQFPPPPSPLPSSPVTDWRKRKLIKIVGGLSGICVLIALTSLAFIIWWRRRKNIGKVPLLDYGGIKYGNDDFSNGELHDENGGGSHEFPYIQLVVINTATQNFCEANKIGEGGFGPVYKGILADGKEIAVKRLSKTSGQGLLEFKNEVILIARLQHRNLVKLLGCCLENNEKLLVYEYMPNKSLDVFLFDAKLSMQLDWQRRFSIISGIARGILYLHEDSRLRIIHRDLKASNILLDNEMNPKISDFGIARIFCGNQNEASTNRIVGT